MGIKTRQKIYDSIAQFRRVAGFRAKQDDLCSKPAEGCSSSKEPFYTGASPVTVNYHSAIDDFF